MIFIFEQTRKTEGVTILLFDATLQVQYIKNLINQGHEGQLKRNQSKQGTLSPTESANMRLELSIPARKCLWKVPYNIL